MAQEQPDTREMEKSYRYGRLALLCWLAAIGLFALENADYLNGLFSILPGLVLASSFGLALFGLIHIIKSFRAGEPSGRLRMTAMLLNGLVLLSMIALLVWNELLN